jgi:hypothetical protein
MASAIEIDAKENRMNRICCTPEVRSVSGYRMEHSRRSISVIPASVGCGISSAKPECFRHEQVNRILESGRRKFATHHRRGGARRCCPDRSTLRASRWPASYAADHRDPPSGSQFVEAVNLGVLIDHMAICFSPRKPPRGAVNGMTWPPCSIWLGSADLSCHPINAYGPRRRGEPHNLSLFALLTLFDFACHAARNLQHLSDYNKNSFRMSDLNCRTVRWKPSLCPRTRDHPVGFGYGNYLPVANRAAHGAACSQVTVE